MELYFISNVIKCLSFIHPKQTILSFFDDMGHPKLISLTFVCSIVGITSIAYSSPETAPFFPSLGLEINPLFDA